MLFLDDWMTERRDGLERVWGEPKFVKEVFSNYPASFLGYGGPQCVFYDETLGRHVMYLTVFPPQADEEAFTVRLQSDDPRNWPNPTYNLSARPAWKGFKDVVVKEDGEGFCVSVPRSLAGTPLAERGYLATSYKTAWHRYASFMAFSDDGLHFKVDWEHPWHNTQSDTWNGILWNERAGVYQIFCRPVNCDRRVSLITTADFEHFSPPAIILQPDSSDPVRTEFYSMPTRRYEDMYVGMLQVYTTDVQDERRLKMDGRNETQLAYSYNGLNWNRTHREPFIRLRDFGLQGGGQLCAQDVLRTPDDKLLIIAAASKGEHNAYPDMQKAGVDTTGYFGPLLYEMRLDGFASLRTSSKNGFLRTKGIIPKATEMSINVRTTAHTAVRVQMLDGDTAKPIPGYTFDEAAPITGDHLFAKPHWKERADLSALVGKPVRIEIEMREAELFAIRLNCRVFVGDVPTEM